jgi:hypothetical protein
MSLCSDCENDLALGQPSVARWKGPDGGEYCSLHFINRFGHGQRLVRLEDFEPPKQTKKAAPKNGRRKPKAQEEVQA